MDAEIIEGFKKDREGGGDNEIKEGQIKYSHPP